MRSDSASVRTARERRGRRAERLAAWYLRFKGYRILARRFRTPVGEIDLIVRRGRRLAFVEVKLRESIEEGLEALTQGQRRRILRAATAFLRLHPQLAGLDLRFDLLLFAPWRPPRHLEDAWRREDDGGSIPA